MKVVNAHKGSFGYKTTVSGLEAHSSATTKGVSAVQNAAEIIHFINTLHAEFAKAPKPGSEFDPPHTTLSVGIVEGGTAINIIARHCSFHWDIRLHPGDSRETIEKRIEAFVRDEVLPRMHAVDPNTGVATESLFRVPALVPEKGSPAEELCRRLKIGRAHV